MKNPVLAEVEYYLVEDNGWTAEEFAKFAGSHKQYINSDGTTTVDTDKWTTLAEDFIRELYRG